MAHRHSDTWPSIAQRGGPGLVDATTLAIVNDHTIDDQPHQGSA